MEMRRVSGATDDFASPGKNGVDGGGLAALIAGFEMDSHQGI
jgi:hypothetical protein